MQLCVSPLISSQNVQAWTLINILDIYIYIYIYTLKVFKILYLYLTVNFLITPATEMFNKFFGNYASLHPKMQLKGPAYNINILHPKMQLQGPA